MASQLKNRIKIKAYRHLYKVFAMSVCRLQNITLLTGSPRSGTTWLGQVLSSPPGCININEPFHAGRLRSLGIDISWRPSLEVDHDAGNKRVYEEIAAGEHITPDMLLDNPWHRFFTAKTFVFKCVRANRTLPYLSRLNFKTPIVCLIRHPLAVIASQMLHEQFPIEMKLPGYDQDYVAAFFPGLKEEINQFKHEEEFRALTWCLDQHQVLTDSARERWVTVYYEQLIMGGTAELVKLYQALKLEPPANLETLVTRKSRESQNWSRCPEEKNLEKRLGAWTGILSTVQVDRVMSVLGMFGVRGYDQEVLPDFEKIEMACNLW